MKRLKSRASSIACIATVIPILLMPLSLMATDDADAQNAALYRMAVDTWKFYAADIDPNTNLPWITSPGRAEVL